VRCSRPLSQRGIVRFEGVVVVIVTCWDYVQVRDCRVSVR
jgi:hypothetical protein